MTSQNPSYDDISGMTWRKKGERRKKDQKHKEVWKSDGER